MPVSRYVRRTVNLKRFAVLVFGVGLVFAAAYGLHGLQVKKNADAMLRSAQNTRKLGNLSESLSLYERYLNFRPRDTEVLAEYAEAMDEMVKAQPQRVRELFGLYERILAADPKRIDDRRKLIDHYLARNQFSRASSHIEALLKADPKLARDPVVLEQYGLCAEKLGDAGKAVDLYREAIETGKASSEVYLKLANLFQSGAGGKASLDESRKLLDRLVADRPKDPAARLARARYFVSLKQPAEAIRELQAAIAANSDAAKNYELIVLLADLHRQEKNLPAARDVLALAVSGNPNEVRFRLRSAEILALLGDTAHAKQQLHEAIRLVPPDDDLAVDVLDRMIAYPELRPEAYEEIHRRFGEKPGSFGDYLSGKLALATGDWPEAQAKLTRALPAFETRKKILARTWEALGHCAKAANNPDRMASCYTAAIAADPLLDSARLGLAEAQARLGHSVAAAETFRKFADVNPYARLNLVQLVLSEQLARPADRRNWSSFDEALGPPPHPLNLELLRVVALRAQNRPSDALALAKELKDRQPELLAPYLELATLQSDSDPKAALATLATAEAKTGDKVELRLVKAGVLAAMPKPDAAAIADLADGTSFSPDDRSALAFGLANVIARRLGKPAEAVPLLRKAAEAKPTDLMSRTMLVDLLISLKRFDEADATIDELRKIEGAEGPSYLFAKVAKDAVALQSKDANKIADLRTKIEVVLKARPTWGRAALLAAELDDFAGDGDAALEKFRHAFALGERRPASVQRLVSLLVARRRFEDARRVLADAEQAIGLNDEMLRTGTLLDSISEKPGPRAAEIVQKAAESKVASDHLFRGQWFLLENRPREAMAAYETAVTLDSASTDGWLGLIMATSAANGPAAANAAWERAKAALTASKPANPALILRLLGVGREVIGDFNGAEKIYRDGLVAHPNQPDLLAQLALLYNRLGRSEDAAGYYHMLLAGNAADSLKRFARRELAIGMMSKPNPFAQVNPALEMLAANTPPSPDDLRTKAIIISLDPYRRIEARKLLDQSATISAPSQDDALRLANFYMMDSAPAKAEEVLRDATRGGSNVPSSLLGLLHQMQCKTGSDLEARHTLERLLKSSPQSWEAAVEMARTLAARGEKAEAAKKVLAHPLLAEPAAKLRLAVPTLAEIGCTEQAEALLKSLVETTKLPNRHVLWVIFLASHGRGLEAIRAALAMPDAEYAPPLKAKLLAAAILPLPRAAVPSYDRDAWDKLVDEVTQWLNAANAPNDASLVTLQGVIAETRGNTAAAIQSFEKAIALDPKSETAANALAYLLVVGPAPDAARAEQLIANLIVQSGPKPALLDTHGLARLALGQTNEAAKDIEAAQVQLPEKAVYWFHLAMVFEKANEFAKRDESLTTALRLGLKKETLHPLEWPAFEKMRMAIVDKR